MNDIETQYSAAKNQIELGQDCLSRIPYQPGDRRVAVAPCTGGTPST